MQAAHDIGDPGLRFGPREMRLYPNGRLAAHVLGGASFGREGVHAAEVVGVAGIEKVFDSRLRDPIHSGHIIHPLLMGDNPGIICIKTPEYLEITLYKIHSTSNNNISFSIFK